MKKIMVKRLMYHNMSTNEIIYGGEEYNGNLSDEQILGCVHEVGKSIFRDRGLVGGQSYLYLLRNDVITHRVTVEQFYYWEDSWYDKLKKLLRR